MARNRGEKTPAEVIEEAERAQELRLESLERDLPTFPRFSGRMNRTTIARMMRTLLLKVSGNDVVPLLRVILMATEVEALGVKGVEVKQEPDLADGIRTGQNPMGKAQEETESSDVELWVSEDDSDEEQLAQKEEEEEEEEKNEDEVDEEAVCDEAAGEEGSRAISSTTMEVDDGEQRRLEKARKKRGEDRKHCRVCDTRFESFAARNRHEREVHRRQCPQCKKIFPSKTDWLKAKDAAMKKAIRCQICGDRCINRPAFREHLMKEHHIKKGVAKQACSRSKWCCHSSVAFVE